VTARSPDEPFDEPPDDDGEVAPVVLAHLSDLHFGAHDEKAVESLVADVHAARPTVIVVTGDLTQRARAHEFAAAMAFLRRLPSPQVVVLGNHDVPLDRLQRLTAPYQRFLHHARLDLDPVMDAGGVRVIGLQSMPRWRWKSGRVSARQAELVAHGPDEPAGNGADPVRVLALHHPVSASGIAGLAGRARLLDALVEGRVEIVLAGHTHRPSTTWLELGTGDRSWCVLEGVTGTATSTRLRGTPRCWTLYRIDDAAITVEERHEAGAGWTTAEVRRFRRRDQE
jgi:3',5'-cyclic AMP phosphodiesterase CpdA